MRLALGHARHLIALVGRWTSVDPPESSFSSIQVDVDLNISRQFFAPCRHWWIPKVVAMSFDNPRLKKIQDLNDALRKTGRGGVRAFDEAIQRQDPTGEFLDEVKRALADCNDFGAEEDEHDSGGFVVRGRHFLWRIDYRSKDRKGDSPDKADPTVTHRDLTVELLDQ